MREKDIERMLIDAVRKAGGIAPKLVCPGLDGMPDRLVLMPGGRAGFVELKAPGKTPRPLQRRRIRELKELGFTVCVADSAEGVAEAVREIEGC